MECGKAPSVARKPKKKPVKDELDRIKQAEKKKRRLEKALATSAAIRSELEKKKQKKKEEQQRLDEEGAAISEAVALHVLLGEDNTENSHCDRGFDLYMGENKPVLYHGELYCKYPFGSGYAWGGNGDWGVSAREDEVYGSNFDRSGFENFDGFSPGLIAAQAVSSLQLGDDSSVDGLVFNRMVRG